MLMRIVLFAAFVGMAGCAVGPDHPDTDFALPDSYATSFDASEASAADEGWWRGFEDPTLNRLVETALVQNLTVEAAAARLEQAEALLRAERSDLFPRIDGTVDARAADPGGETAEAGFVGVFTPDLFGRLRRELEAARYTTAAADAQLADARRLTAAAISASFINLRRTEARIALLEESLGLQQQTLRIVRLRAQAGLAADLDVQRTAADLARTRAQSGPLLASRAAADYTIALLTGDVPGFTTIAGMEEPTVPHYAGGPAVGIPAQLLRRRPDIRAAEAQLLAASARIGVEAADLYPRLDLSGFVTSDLKEGSFGADPISVLVGSLALPLLDGGRRRAEVRAAQAATEAALANYRFTLLDAVRDTETALIGIDAAQARRADLAEAVAASEQAFNQLQALYKEGLATLIDVLDAQRQLIAGRESFVESEADLAQAYVNLYAAIGAPTPMPDV
ncbi:MAG: efflux transporter outer membrane subunit [Parvularcula sp.]|jgi:multidrug efflux system outer membrane protein|nr:efflux transporter outer membrane subunit [Parvularcula sp.]